MSLSMMMFGLMLFLWHFLFPLIASEFLLTYMIFIPLFLKMTQKSMNQLHMTTKQYQIHGKYSIYVCSLIQDVISIHSYLLYSWSDNGTEHLELALPKIILFTFCAIEICWIWLSFVIENCFLIKFWPRNPITWLHLEMEWVSPWGESC